MKYLSFIFCFLISIICYSQEYNLEDVRECYLEVADFENKKLLRKMTIKNFGNPVMKAYNNTANLMLLSHLYNPVKKYLIFKRHTQDLDFLIQENQTNLEIRLLRYAVQNMSPDFLNYNKDLNEDLSYILLNLDSEPNKLRSYLYKILKKINDAKTSNTSK